MITDDGSFNDWVHNNSEPLLEQYIEQLDDFPEEIYEGIVDDLYPEAEEMYCNNLTMDDIPDEFLQNVYNSEAEE